MQKSSTMRPRGSRIFRGGHLTIGLDLGDRSSCYCVLDEAGQMILERSLPTTSKAMEPVFGRMTPSRIAPETGTHSPWVSRLLTRLGHEVIVAHARNVRLIGESRRKDDRIDARTLAHAPSENRSPNSADGRMATEAARLEGKEPQEEEGKNPLDTNRPSHGRT